MRIIEIAAQENGAHRNQTGEFIKVPDGWAIVPDDMKIPDTFPFVNLTVNDGVVASMTEGDVPEYEAEPEEPTQLDIIEAQVMYTAMMTDTLIEG